MKFGHFLETNEKIQNLADRGGVDIKGLKTNQLSVGLRVEKEHKGKMGRDTEVAKNDVDVLKIAVAHLREDPYYYSKLIKAGL
jgi:hypothetical protein